MIFFNKYFERDSIKYSTFFIFIFCSVGALLKQGSALNDYMIGEWLINYDGGFVRRGLSGSLFFILSDALRVNTEILVNYFIIGLFLVNLCFVLKMLRVLNSFQSFWFLFAPALFLMVPTDTLNRKDNLFYLCFLIHSVLIISKSPRLRIWQCYVLPIAGCLIALVHELYVFFIPYHLMLILGACEQGGKRRRVIWANCIPLLLLIPLTYFHGGDENFYRMCPKLFAHGFKCSGGILFVKMTLFESVQTAIVILKDSYSLGSYLTCYLVTNGVTSVLFKNSLKKLYNKNFLKCFVGCNLIFLIILPLGEDFGRWITMFSVHNFLVLAVMVELNKTDSEVLEKSVRVLIAQWFVLITISAIFNTKLYGVYDKTDYPLIPGKLTKFLEDGLNVFVKSKRLNFEKHTLNYSRVVEPLNTGEVVNFKDKRLYYFGWGDEEQVRWTTSHHSAIFFKWDTRSPLILGEIEMAIGGVARKQRVTVFLNDVKIGAVELDKGAEKALFKFSPGLINPKHIFNQLRLELPDAARPGNGDLRELSFYLRELVLK